MKTLLVSFQNNTNTVGLKYLHSYLQKNDKDSTVLFLPHYNKNTNKEILRFIEKFNPQIIGISLMTPEFRAAKDFTLLIKKNISSVTFVWGGIHPSIATENCLKYTDYCIIGEAELSFLELINSYNNPELIKKVKNIAYKEGNKVIKNKVRSPIQNLDILYFPEFCPKKSYILAKGKIRKMNKSLFRRYTRYSGKAYDLVTTRGCPFSCTYCCNSFLSKLYPERKIRTRSVENCLEELEEAVKEFPDILYINILDDCFLSYDLEWLTKFSEGIKKRIKRDIICCTTPIHVNEAKIKVLKEAGLSWILVGLESGSERINYEVYKRFVSNDKFIETAKIIGKYNIAGRYDIILDNPYETEEDVIETINCLLKIPKPYQLELFSLWFFPGTELYERAKKDNINITNPLDKNYSVFKKTTLNRIIRFCPLYPAFFINFLVNNRKSFLGKSLVNLLYYPSLLLELFSYFRLILISLNYNIIKSFKMIFYFSKNAIWQLIFRQN